MASIATVSRGQPFFADSAQDYIAGTGTSGFQNTSSALGKPVDDTGFGMLTPFNSAFSSDHLLGVGPGGTVTLHLARTASSNGTSLGIHAAVGLIDNDWPNGQAGNPATAFTNPRVANVQVSYDGNRWMDLGTHAFDSPTNYYAEGISTPGYQPAPGTAEADWAKPFTLPLSAFNGENWSQMLTTLSGSAGGTWLPVAAPSLPAINYVKISTPASASYPMYVDAVVGNTQNVSVPSGSTMTVSAPVSEGTYGTVLVNNGTFRIDGDIGVLGAHPSSAFINLAALVKSAGAGTATISSSFTSDAGSIDVQSGTLALPVALTVSGARAVHAARLSISSGASLDLADNDLIVEQGDYTAIRALVSQGFGGAPGIISSLSDGSQILALFDNSLANHTSWQGETIGASAVVGRYTYLGDANMDGQVSGDDYTLVDSNLRTTPPVGMEWLRGDMNRDGTVTGDDYTTIDSNLGKGAGNPPAPSRISSLAVPEPATLSLLAMAGLLTRRRRVT